MQPPAAIMAGDLGSSPDFLGMFHQEYESCCNTLEQQNRQISQVLQAAPPINATLDRLEAELNKIDASIQPTQVRMARERLQQLRESEHIFDQQRRDTREQLERQLSADGQLQQQYTQMKQELQEAWNSLQKSRTEEVQLRLQIGSANESAVTLKAQVNTLEQQLASKTQENASAHLEHEQRRNERLKKCLAEVQSELAKYNAKLQEFRQEPQRKPDSATITSSRSSIDLARERRRRPVSYAIKNPLKWHALGFLTAFIVCFFLSVSLKR